MKTRLKELMQEKGMMSKTLAEKIGISEVSVSALVNGKSNNLDTLAKAAQCLGVPLWQLFVDPSEVIAQANQCEERQETRCPHCGELLHITIK